MGRKEIDTDLAEDLRAALCTRQLSSKLCMCDRMKREEEQGKIQFHSIVTKRERESVCVCVELYFLHRETDRETEEKRERERERGIQRTVKALESVW